MVSGPFQVNNSIMPRNHFRNFFLLISRIVFPDGAIHTSPRSTALQRFLMLEHVSIFRTFPGARASPKVHLLPKGVFFKYTELPLLCVFVDKCALCGSSLPHGFHFQHHFAGPRTPSPSLLCCLVCSVVFKHIV